MSKNKNRPDQDGKHRAQFDKNKKRIYATQSICGICGQPVDFTLKFPHPLSPTVDHILPIAKGGHPSDIDNLQLAHFYCNRQKSDRIEPMVSVAKKEDALPNRDLPQTMDWSKYSSKD